jgi:Ice-binding-like
MIQLKARLTLLIPLAASLSFLACGGSSTAPSLTSVKQAATSSAATAASSFAVLANAAATCTDGNITGDVGTFLATPPGMITLTTCPLTGSTHIGDATSIAAYQAFLSTYAALAPKTTDVCPIITGTLAGQNLAPGVYCVSSEAKTGVLTLNGPSTGTWIFKVPSGALTGTNFSVVMAGGGQACNVTWWVDAASTMKTSAFQGNILAGAGITTTGGTLHGDVFAGAKGVGDVTITGTVVTACASIVVSPPPPPPPCTDKDGKTCKCKHHDGDEDEDGHVKRDSKRGHDECDDGDDDSDHGDDGDHHSHRDGEHERD